MKQLRQKYRTHIIATFTALILLLAACTPPPQSPSHFITESATRHGGQVSGMAIRVFTHDQILFEDFFGYANEADGLIVQPNTVFKWGSITKSLTWIAILQLMEEGALDIHVDIRTYISDDFLPELKYPTTVYHLMTHSSGFIESDFFWYRELAPILEPPQDMTLIAYALRSMDMRQRLEPGGASGEYSHYNVVLASYIVEQVSGMAFYEYVQKYIFGRLGMEYAALLNDFSDNVWLVSQLDRQVCYLAADRRFEAECFGVHRVVRQQFYMIGGAASVVSDFHRFAIALMPFNNEHSLFEEYETLLKLHSLFEYEIAAYTDTESGIFALNGQMCHTATVLIDTQRNMGVVVMTNQEGEGFFNRVSFLREVVGRFDVYAN